MNGYQSTKRRRQIARTFFKNISNYGKLARGKESSTFNESENGTGKMDVIVPLMRVPTIRTVIRAQVLDRSNGTLWQSGGKFLLRKTATIGGEIQIRNHLHLEPKKSIRPDPI
jgi:hypothetical protein